MKKAAAPDLAYGYIVLYEGRPMAFEKTGFAYYATIGRKAIPVFQSREKARSAMNAARNFDAAEYERIGKDPQTAPMLASSNWDIRRLQPVETWRGYLHAKRRK